MADCLSDIHAAAARISPTLSAVLSAPTEPTHQQFACDFGCALLLTIPTDEALRKDKAGRKEEGLQVVRLGEKRTILTQLGELCYHRTYYRNTRTGKYIYPIDQIVGVSPYCRVEAGLGEQLVRESLPKGSGNLHRESGVQTARKKMCKKG